MRILIWSHAGCHTGFATVTDNLARRFAAMGADCHVLAINYQGDPWPAPYKLYPASKYEKTDVHGLGRLRELHDRLKPDVFFIVNDLGDAEAGKNALGGSFLVPTVLYAPIDGIRLPKSWQRAMQSATKTVLMSRFGERVVREEFGIEAGAIWHGVEHDLVFPVSAGHPIRTVNQGHETLIMNKSDAKRFLNLQDRFVILAANRNASRKNYYDTVRVFAEFHRRHPDALLYIFAVRVDEGGDLQDLLEKYDLKPDSVILDSRGDTFIGVPKQYLTLLYNAADVKLSTSTGEGFGLTDAEAVACGVPVVAQDCSATTEVVGPAGLLAPIERHITNYNLVDYALPDLGKIDEALETLYHDDDLRNRLGQLGTVHAKQFDWDVAAERFFHIFRELSS